MWIWDKEVVEIWLWRRLQIEVRSFDESESFRMAQREGVPATTRDPSEHLLDFVYVRDLTCTSVDNSS